MNKWFAQFSVWLSNITGRPYTFLLMLSLLVIWACSGPYFQFNDTWQLIANTATSLITFLMVFIIQNSQNRDIKAIHLKLDELLRAMTEARNDLMDAEEKDDEELQVLVEEYKRLHRVLGANAPDLRAVGDSVN